MILIVEPMIPALRRYARALLRDASAADDLVQDCLERAVAHWHRRQTDGSPRAWLFTILHNLAMSRMRTASRRGGHVELEEADPAAVSIAPAQESPRHRRDILAALDRLPEDQRQTLLLITLEEMSYADAARILDVPIGTVMSRLSRARTRLRAILDDEGEGRPSLRRVK